MTREDIVQIWHAARNLYHSAGRASESSRQMREQARSICIRCERIIGPMASTKAEDWVI